MININDLYNKQYYAARMDWKPDVYPIISEAILKHFKPKTLIDVGCGNGALLEGLRGIDAVGIDGSMTAVNICLHSGLNVCRDDLRKPFSMGNAKKFDLAVSIEVAEHIEKEYEDIFLDSLCNLSDTIIMTASPEHDGGKYHFNVHPKSYWCGKMNIKGFCEILPISFMKYLWDNIPPERDYLWKNMMIFNRINND